MTALYQSVSDEYFARRGLCRYASVARFGPTHPVHKAPHVAGVIGVGIWFAAGIAWFAVVGRRRLVMAPEEAFALDASKTG
jgi:hypothetical protein